MDFSLNENVWNITNISLNFASKGVNDTKSALGQVMAWCQKGNKPLPETMLTEILDAI